MLEPRVLRRAPLPSIPHRRPAGTTRETKTWIAKGCDRSRTRPWRTCRWPFVRMGGQSTYNRSSLTVNHGTYYLDTSVTLDQQLTENFSNTKPCPTRNKRGHPSLRAAQRQCVRKGEVLHVLRLCEDEPPSRPIRSMSVPASTSTPISKPSGRCSTPCRCRESNTTTWPAKWTKNYNDTVACAPLL